MAASIKHPPDAVVRCPACGHPQKGDSSSACRLCGFKLGDKRVTSDDTTPYALAYAEGNRAWWRMCRWVWGATTERLKHLALMRSSAASRRFAFVNILLLAFAAVVLQAASNGWHTVSVALTEGLGAVEPEGKGWLHILSRRQASGAIGKQVDAWWNPPQTIMAAAAGFVAALLVCFVLMGLTRWLIERVHRRAYRGEQRMTAALAYSTAWIVPALPAAIVIAFLPVASIGEQARSAIISGAAVAILAALIAAPPAVLWWVWLVRLGATAPVESRGSVQTLFVAGVPLLTIAAAVGWWLGLQALLRYLFLALGLNF